MASQKGGLYATLSTLQSAHPAALRSGLARLNHSVLAKLSPFCFGRRGYFYAWTFAGHASLFKHRAELFRVHRLFEAAYRTKGLGAFAVVVGIGGDDRNRRRLISWNGSNQMNEILKLQDRQTPITQDEVRRRALMESLDGGNAGFKHQDFAGIPISPIVIVNQRTSPGLSSTSAIRIGFSV